MTDKIKHLGTVEHIEGTRVQVRIVQTSACSSCSAKSFCSSSESKEKLIDIDDSAALSYRVGQEVMVCGTTSMGMRAVGLAFGVPFLVLMAVLVVAYACTDGNELLSSLAALSSLIPYYIVLYLCKDKVKRRFSFSLEPINQNN